MLQGHVQRHRAILSYGLGFIIGCSIFSLYFRFIHQANYVTSTIKIKEQLEKESSSDGLGQLVPVMSHPVKIKRPSTDSKILEGGIPRMIHQTWETRMIPVQFARYVTSWREHHTDWTHILWTTKGGKKLIHDKFPNMTNTYDNYKLKLQKADVRKFFTLYEYGGVYADLDTESLGPIDSLLSKYPCLLGQEPDMPSTGNTFPVYSFMACRPKHPFFKLVIEMLQEYQGYYPLDVLRSTGPIFLTEVLDIYINIYNKTTEEYIYIAPSKWFKSVHEKVEELHSTKVLCDTNDLSAQEKLNCEQLVANVFNNTTQISAYASHYWKHTLSATYRKDQAISIADVIRDGHIL